MAPPNSTPPDPAYEARAIVWKYENRFFIFGWLFTFLYLALTIRQVRKGQKFTLLRYLTSVVILCALILPCFGSRALAYLGVPKQLTFGYQIGAALPASCEASMPIEGLEGDPCMLKRFREWVSRVLRTEDGSWHLEEFERAWG